MTILPVDDHALLSARLYGLCNYLKALKKAIIDDTSTQDQIESNT